MIKRLLYDRYLLLLKYQALDQKQKTKKSKYQALNFNLAALQSLNLKLNFDQRIYRSNLLRTELEIAIFQTQYYNRAKIRRANIMRENDPKETGSLSTLTSHKNERIFKAIIMVR